MSKKTSFLNNIKIIAIFYKNRLEQHCVVFVIFKIAATRLFQFFANRDEGFYEFYEITFNIAKELSNGTVHYRLLMISSSYFQFN